jgi:hypothetical protein
VVVEYKALFEGIRQLCAVMRGWGRGLSQGFIFINGAVEEDGALDGVFVKILRLQGRQRAYAGRGGRQDESWSASHKIARDLKIFAAKIFIIKCRLAAFYSHIMAYGSANVNGKNRPFCGVSYGLSGMKGAATEILVISLPSPSACA